LALSLATAQMAAEGAIRRACELDVKIAVVVVDEAGMPVSLARMDGTLGWAWQIAEAKAVGCALWQRDGDYIANVAHERPTDFAQFSKMPILRGLPLIPAEGGLVIKRDGAMVGAIGVSGGGASGDKACAQAGLEAVAEQR
jgi:uncharacterized protein GlcG (DUF336 family)